MLKGYKTLIVNGALALFALVGVINPGAELPTADDVGTLVDQTDALLLLGVALVNMVLRAVTTSPAAPIIPRKTKE